MEPDAEEACEARRYDLMAVYTDSPGFASNLLPERLAREMRPATAADPEIEPVLGAMFPATSHLFATSSSGLPWPLLLISEFSSGSQYDKLIDLARVGRVPHGTACLAGAGSGFHGFKGRAWEALPGNLHFSIHLSPRASVDRFPVAFTALAALSVAEALDGVPGLSGKAGIKWVNDILLAGAKVAGVLAYTQSQGERVTSAVLGIGLNVETAPAVDPTPFVPKTTSVREMARSAPPEVRRKLLLGLMVSLDANYRTLLEEGFTPLLQRYRNRSVVIGREVTVCSERSNQELEVLDQGRVEGLGENMELILEGREHPVTTGRLAMGPSTAYTWQLAPEARTDRGSISESDDAR